MNKCLDGAFQEQAPFTEKDPLAMFTFLFTFKGACDASGASHGQALALLSFRQAGAAKTAFSSAVAVQRSISPHAILTHGGAVNWLLQKYAPPTTSVMGLTPRSSRRRKSRKRTLERSVNASSACATRLTAC